MATERTTLPRRQEEGAKQNWMQELQLETALLRKQIHSLCQVFFFWESDLQLFVLTFDRCGEFLPFLSTC